MEVLHDGINGVLASLARYLETVYEGKCAPYDATFREVEDVKKLLVAIREYLNPLDGEEE